MTVVSVTQRAIIMPFLPLVARAMLQSIIWPSFNYVGASLANPPCFATGYNSFGYQCIVCIACVRIRFVFKERRHQILLISVTLIFTVVYIYETLCEKAYKCTASPIKLMFLIPCKSLVMTPTALSMGPIKLLYIFLDSFKDMI